MTEDQIKHMVDRFLSWELPSDFYPDGGVTRDKTSTHQPVGTNLLTATQATEMVRHMIDGLS